MICSEGLRKLFDLGNFYFTMLIVVKEFQLHVDSFSPVLSLEGT